MKEVVSFAVLGWMFTIILAVILIAVLYYYLAKVDFRHCKNACMSNCRNCRRNCECHKIAIQIDERYKDCDTMKEMMKMM